MAEQGPHTGGGGAAACGNCGTALAGPFCGRCGAQDLAGRDFSVRHFAADLAAELTDLQRSKLLATLTALLFRPGLLTRENFTARRVRYLKPITLTLAVFALHLFVFTSGAVPGYDLRRMVPEAQRSVADSPGARLWAAVEREAAATRATPDAVAERINDRWIRNYSLGQIPLILLLAGWSALVLLPARRFFVEHLVFGMHLIAFTGLTISVIWPLVHLVAPGPGATNLFLFVKLLFDACWVSLAARGAFGFRGWRAWAAGSAVQGGYFILFQLVNYLALGEATRHVLAG